MTRWLTVHDRPAEFELAKYRPLESMTVEGWHCQLNERRQIPRWARRKPELFARVTSKLLDGPMLTPWGFSEPAHAREIAELMLPSDRERCRAAVGSMTVGSGQALAEWMQRTGLLENDDLMYRLVDDENAERDDQFQDPTMALVHVNLDMEPAVLKSEFSKWLTHARRARGLSAAGGQIDTDKWTDRCLLPYFDLRLWAMARSARWRNDALAAILFEHDFDRDGAYISNVVRVKTATMMSRRMLRRLSVEAMREDDG